jgi:hypothetical protein
MAGIRDTEAKRKLLALTPFPSAQQAINMCRSEEAARMNERSLSNQSSINHVRPHQRNDATAASCGSCGRNIHRPGEACPATGKTCHNCGGSNHFSPRCPKPRRSSNTGQSGGGTGKSEGAQPGSGGSSTGGFPSGPRTKGKIGRIVVGSIRNPRRWRRAPTVSLRVLDDKGQFLSTIDKVIPDGGAEVSVGGLDILMAIGMTEKDLDTSSFDLVMADKTTPLIVIGQVTIVTEYEGTTTTLTIVISPEISGLLISWYDCISLGILHADYPKPVRYAHINSTPVKESHQEAAPPSSIPESIAGDPTEEQKNRMEQAFLEEFSDVFDQNEELGCMEGPPMVITLKDDALPYYVNGARPIPFADRPQVKKKLDELVDKKIIIPVNEPSDWAAPLVVMRKPDSSIRLTKLNHHVQRPTHPTRTPRDAVAEIDGQARFFSTFDATNGYFQIPLHPDSQHLTTFMTPWGRYKFLRAPMGLCSSSDEYNRRADLAFAQVTNTSSTIFSDSTPILPTM